MTDRLNIGEEDLRQPIVITDQDIRPHLVVTGEDVGLYEDAPESAQNHVAAPEFGGPLSSLKQRMHNLGERLVADQVGNNSWSQSLKKYVGNSLLAYEDKQFRSTFYQGLGGTAVYYAGGILTSLHPDSGVKTMGVLLTLAGAAKYMDSERLNIRRYQSIVR